MSDIDNKGAPTEPVEQNSRPQRSILSIIRADPWAKDVSEIVHWREPIKSGMIFGIINFSYFLYEFYDYTVITLGAYLALALALVCLSYANFVVYYGKFVQKKDNVENPFLTRFQGATFEIPPQTVEKHLNTFVDIINALIRDFKIVFYSTDTALTLKWIAYFYLIATVGSWFGGATLLYFGVLAAFLWPRLYEEKKKEIDQAYAVASTEADKYCQMALEKVPPQVQAYVPALTPRKKKN
eukprot:TRINITY_DN252_c0_g1_i1.p1 TRINITY_DN252_c0_g1~~TRINITY_DN252_c0_g1_i1.p1  ORF type:complete len:240 (-),score=64.97 TRINITY_DN252_c0_g1_i1:113-832(-)